MMKYKKRAGDWKVLSQNHKVMTLYTFGSSTNDEFDPFRSGINKYNKKGGSMRHLVSVLIIGSLLIIACHQVPKIKDNITKSQKEQEIIHVIKKLHKAMNEHNLDAMLDCVDSGYISEQPFYPDRNFAGREQMKKNWTGILENYPDFSSSLTRYSVSNDTIWAEWHWTGTQEDSSQLNMVGVTIFKVEGGRITNGRLFMKSVE